MKTILFPTRFSAQAPQRLSTVRHLAHETGARVIVVHAYEIAEEYNYPSGILFQHVLEDYENKHTEAFRKLIRTIPEQESEKLQFEFYSYTGSPAHVILLAADQFEPDAILMGGKEYGQVSTTTERVIRKADCPVLAIPPNHHLTSLPPLVYATNFRKEDTRIIDKLLGFARTFATQLHCIHIKQDNSPIDQRKLVPWLEEYADAIEERLISFEVVYFEQVPHKLDLLWKKNQNGLWVMPFEKTNWLQRLLSSGRRSEVGMSPAHSPLLALTRS